MKRKVNEVCSRREEIEAYLLYHESIFYCIGLCERENEILIPDLVDWLVT